ncbi:MAG: formate dehydrogenase accessory sulfurtransferase FdhD [Paenibacillaceae bacterium]
MKHTITTPWQMIKFDGAVFSEQEDEIVTETPLTIRINGEELATVVCTPNALEDLTVGFLAAEGLIHSIADIDQLSVNEERGFADVELKVKKSISHDYYAKRFISSCCGKSRQFYYHNDMRTAKTIMSQTKIAPAQCIFLMKELFQSSTEFQKTGGVHNAALCHTTGILVSRADIGRHNTLDKIYGHCLREKLNMSDKIIAFSGRMSSEIVLKSAKMGVGILLSNSAPSDLALQLAHDLQITAIGFIREGQMNIYTHPQRVIQI